MEKNNFSILFFIIYFLIKIKQIFASTCKEVEAIFGNNTAVLDADTDFTRDVAVSYTHLKRLRCFCRFGTNCELLRKPALFW